MRHIGGDPRREGQQTPEGRRRFKKNYDNVKEWGQPDVDRRPGSYYMVDGDLVHESDLTDEQRVKVTGKTRAMDSHNIASEAMGCAPKQVKQFNENLVKSGIAGAKYDRDGTLHMRDRATKFKVMKVRGMHDRDEVRG